MKKTIVQILLITATLILFFNNCKKEEQEVDYTYTFYDVRWSDNISDNDADGYASGAILNCFVNLEENVTRNIYAELYFRLENSDEIIYYSSSSEFVFDGVDSPLLIPFSIGAVVSDLAQGNYEFIVEIYEVGSDRLEASTDGSELKIFKQFERLLDDQSYIVTATWSDDEDTNTDGYAYNSTLNINVDITDELSKNLKAEVLYKTTGAEDDTYKVYKTLESFEITGSNTDDSVNINVGRNPDTLSHGEYDFKILVYERFGFFPVATLSYENDNNLRKKFQKKTDDNYYITINTDDINWSSSTDNDGDGYARSRTLTVDINMEKDSSELNIITKLYIKHPDSTSYSTFDSTAVYTIIGKNTSDAINFVVSNRYIIQYSDPAQNDTIYIDHLRYDFMLEAESRPFDLNITKASISADSLTILRNVQFESAGDD